MAGRARMLAISDELAKRVRDTFDPEPDEEQPSSLDYVCHWMESGKTAKALAQDISNSLPFEFDYAAMMRYLRNSYGDTAVEGAMDAARARASHSLAEDAVDIVDKADRDSTSAVSKAAAQARSRQWMAERYNPARFGQKTQQNVAISVNVLHLDALRAKQAEVTGALNGATHNTTLPNTPNAEVVAIASVSTASE